MEFISEEMLRNLSAQDMEQLRREMRNLSRRLRQELGRRTRYCAHCGDRLGASDYGFRYCSAWHRYLDGHKHKSTLSRVEFERRRALNRIRTIKKEPGTAAAPSTDSNADEVKELRASLRILKIRRVMNEYRTITGESLKKSVRDSGRYKTKDH